MATVRVNVFVDQGCPGDAISATVLSLSIRLHIGQRGPSVETSYALLDAVHAKRSWETPGSKINSENRLASAAVENAGRRAAVS